jgi:hypothetical protein
MNVALDVVEAGRAKRVFVRAVGWDGDVEFLLPRYGRD